MKINELSLRPYPRVLLEELCARTPLKGKTVLEIGAETSFQMAQAMLCLGAEHVWAANPAFPEQATPPDPRISCLRTLGEQLSLPDGCADIIWGNALLEHVSNPSSLAVECRRLLSSQGECFLQGNPLWTSSYGHHIKCTAPSGNTYHYSTKTVPFEPWEHLTLQEEHIINLLHTRNIPEEDIALLSNLVLHDPSISRLPPEKIISAFEIDNTHLEIARRMFGPAPNIYYKRALTQFSEDDLRTTDLQIRMIHSGGRQQPLYISLGSNLLPSIILRRGNLRSLTMRSPDCLPFDFCTSHSSTILKMLLTNFKHFASHLQYNTSKGVWENSLLNITFNGDNDCKEDDRMRIEIRLLHRIQNFHNAMRSQRPVIFVVAAYHNADISILAKIRDSLRLWREERPYRLLIWGEDSQLLALKNEFCAVCLSPHASEIFTNGAATSDPLSSDDGQKILSQLVAWSRQHTEQLYR